MKFEEKIRSSFSYTINENAGNVRDAILYQVNLLVKAIEHNDINLYKPITIR